MSDTNARQELHRRSVEHRTWLHEDGSLEIEGRLIDTKAYDTRIGFGRPLAAGEPVHDMTIRILLGPDHRIREIKLSMEGVPFDVCPEIIQRFEELKGVSMGRGWNALLSKRFSGAGGCRHLIDLLRGMATVVFQSLSRGDWTREVLEGFGDSCHAFRSGGPVMVQLMAGVESKNPQTNE